MEILFAPLQLCHSLSLYSSESLPMFWFSYRYCKTTPQKGLAGKVIRLSQGKLIGGSGAIHRLAFVTQSKAATDAWADFGNPGWDGETLGPYYKKFQTLSRPSPTTAEHLRLSYLEENVGGSDGLIQTSFPNELGDPLPSAWSTRSPCWASPFPETRFYRTRRERNPSTAHRQDLQKAQLSPW